MPARISGSRRLVLSEVLVRSVCVGLCGSGLRHQCVGKQGLRAPCLGEPLAQLGAKAAKFFDAGDDAVLLSEGWETEPPAKQLR